MVEGSGPGAGRAGKNCGVWDGGRRGWCWNWILASSTAQQPYDSLEDEFRYKSTWFTFIGFSNNIMLISSRLERGLKVW